MYQIISPASATAGRDRRWLKDGR